MATARASNPFVVAELIESLRLYDHFWSVVDEHVKYVYWSPEKGKLHGFDPKEHSVALNKALTHRDYYSKQIDSCRAILDDGPETTALKRELESLVVPESPETIVQKILRSIDPRLQYIGY
jgi:hypothetical protein